MICKNCRSEFPAKTFLDGKEVCLHKRAYCLKCSPYGERKYKNLACRELKDCKQCPICSKVFKRTKSNVCSTCRFWFQRHKKKLKAIALLGGECRNCGEKDWEVLTFHHKDKENKLFTLSMNWGSKDWKLVEQELEKCELLCSNCHIKHHRGEFKERERRILAYYGQVVE